MAKRGWRVGVGAAPGECKTSQRLDRYLAEHLDLPRNRVQSWIREGRVAVEGELARASRLVTSGDLVEVDPPDPAPSELVPTEGPLRFLVCEDSFWILDKPPDLVVHPGAGTGNDTLVHRLLHLDPSIATVGSPERPGIVHRLDRGTTGAMAIARTDRAYRQLSAAFAQRRVVKVYLAIAHGKVPAEGRWSWPLDRHPTHRTRMTIAPRGRSAVTDYRQLALACDGLLSLLALRLHTGRTHQIRAHLKAARHPLVGDPVYGEDRWRCLPRAARVAVRDFPRPALHAWRLELPHPTRPAEWVSATAPPPRDLVELWRAVGGQDLSALEPPTKLCSRLVR
jgi:23S rRNA pseudouridine1911/1915/1917 synthase